jgi:hypothetical protein
MSNVFKLVEKLWKNVEIVGNHQFDQMITKVEGTNQIEGFNDVVLVGLDCMTKHKRRKRTSQALIMGPDPLNY